MLICQYGCNREAKYQLKNGKWCCSPVYNSCPNSRKKTSTSLKGRKLSKEHIKALTGRKLSKDHIKAISKGNKGKTISKEGIRWEPLESADIDKCITVCKDCHIKIHQIPGCTYADMRCKEVI